MRGRFASALEENPVGVSPRGFDTREVCLLFKQVANLKDKPWVGRRKWWGGWEGGRVYM